MQNHSISENFLTRTFIKIWKNFLPTWLLGTACLLFWGHFPTCTIIWTARLFCTREYARIYKVFFHQSDLFENMPNDIPTTFYQRLFLRSLIGPHLVKACYFWCTLYLMLMCKLLLKWKKLHWLDINGYYSKDSIQWGI